MSELNGVMMQYFHWYNRADGMLWIEAASRAKELAAAGITAIWLPPAYKGNGGAADVGYAVYDLYDLGEFDQKGSVSTKYGTRADYVEAVKALQAAGIQVYADTVLNHRMGGEQLETVRATPYSQDDRNQGRGPTRDIHAWTRFDFPGRKNRHSTFQWRARHFDAVDYDHGHPRETNTVYLFEGKRFDTEVALEKGNFSYLMGCDLDFESEEVRAELTAWGKWYLDTTGVDGFRLDAVKHIAAWFFPQWLDEMEKHAGRKLFCVGEYWAPETSSLVWYLDRLGGRSSAFDVPMHYHFHAASLDAGYDMRKLLDNTVTQQRPGSVVTFADNHDSQPLQALESPVAPWFKPLAYATILLRRDGYPCVFYPDYYGAEYDDVGRDGNRHHVVMPSHRWLIDRFLDVRKRFAWGPQLDYADHWNRVGWTRLGDEEHPGAMAVLMSDGPEGSKWMDVGKPHTRFVDVTEHVREPITTNEHGWGDFRCNGGSVSVWIPE
ncbi:MAG: alpha-amylase [Deltaproteobacteria bacterium]|nr:alpha-amylase [Deltaproteobacteria bacterium]